MKGNNLSDVKKADRQVVYEYIWSHKATTMTGTAHTTCFSRPAVTSLVQEMTVDNLVVKSGYNASNGDRNPVSCHANAGAVHAMGIDLEFPKVCMAISNLECENICFSVRTYPRDLDKDQTIHPLKQRASDLTQGSGIDRSRLLGVGMRIPGVIDCKQNHSMLFGRIEGWGNASIGDIIQRYVGKPIYMCNNVNFLPWAEKKAAHLENVQNMLYTVICSGIGMAIWTDGSLMQGEIGSSGRIDHTTANKNGLECKCGSCGCLGLYTGEEAAIQIYSGLIGEEIRQAGDLVPLVESGDKTALQIFGTCGRYLGIGVVNVVNLSNISGVAVSASFDVSYILKNVQCVLDVRKMNTMCREVKIREGSLAESGFGLGGRFLALNKEHVSLLGG